jgi:hypothetical protein
MPCSAACPVFGNWHLGVSLFPEIGAPIIAFAEIALLIEAIILLIWLSRRTHEPLKTNSAIIKGLIAAVVGGLSPTPSRSTCPAEPSSLR